MSAAQPKATDGQAIAGHLAAVEGALAPLAADGALMEAAARVAQAWILTFDGGGKLLLCGDAAGLALAQRLALRLVSRGSDRTALPVLSLGADGALVTAIAGQSEPAQVFARQVAAFGGPRDGVVALCAGPPPDAVAEALKSARAVGAVPLAIGGPEVAALAPLCDRIVTVAAPPGTMDDVLGTLLSAICAVVEGRLFPHRVR